MDDIISGNIDIYAELQLDKNASAAEISRAYRKNALLFHPDKNKAPLATQKFHLLTIINDILSDPDLKARYDALRNQSKDVLELSRSVQAQEFRAKLQKAEAALQRQKYQSSTQKSQINVQKLEMEGLRLRYEYQRRHTESSDYVSFRDIPQNGPDLLSTLSSPCKVQVRWKQKTDARAQIDSEILQEIMSIFGPVQEVSVGGFDGKYATGSVVFQQAEDARKAASYNYSSASLWDGTRVRKTASLLRGCVLDTEDARLDTYL